MDLAMLNRLRVNAGKPELKSWKASKALLQAAIKGFRDQGFVDVVPGAKVDAAPVLPPDPELAKAFKEEEKQEKTVTKIKAGLARGTESAAFCEHSRKAVQDLRIKEKKEAKEERKQVKLSEKDKKQIKEEAEERKPSKEERQKKHIEEKRAKRAAEGKLKPPKEKNADEVTVADIARDLDINPKIARAKLRRHEDKKDYPAHTKGQDRWTFPKAARKQLEKILKGAK